MYQYCSIDRIYDQCLERHFYNRYRHNSIVQRFDRNVLQDTNTKDQSFLV